MFIENDLNRQHLLAELSRIDFLIRREVRRWQLAGQDPADIFRGLYISDAEAQDLVVRPFAATWGNTISLEPAEEQALNNALLEITSQIAEIKKEAQQQGCELAIDRLERIFGLSQFEIDTLIICLAPHLDMRYERLFGYLQDDVTRKHPTVNLVLNLLSEPGEARLPAYSSFLKSAPLLQHNLVSLSGDGNPGTFHLLSRTIHLDETIVNWLMGNYQPGEGNGRYFSRLEEPSGEDTDVLMRPVADDIKALIESNPVLVFYGPDQASQEAAVLYAARILKRQILKIDMSIVVKNEGSPLAAIDQALRDSRLMGYLPFFSGWDDCLEDGVLPAPILAALCSYAETVIVGGRSHWQATGIQRDRIMVWLEFPIPMYEQRLAAWNHFLNGKVDQQSINLSSLAGAFALSTSQIRDAVATAGDLAMKEGRPVAQEHLYQAARSHSNPRLSRLARKITPRYSWEDIVLPEDQLNLLTEIMLTVRNRPQVLEEWGLGRKLVSSRGITVLFAGPPGTGKTMAAEIIARELQLDLYKIDLSNVVSKYIGETEKNLEKIFSEAEASNAILFFDEADALFGKRSEVRDSHDRYANIEISYLLQRMEGYDGVSILATNLRANLDEAFTRRLQFAVDFPFPTDEYRQRIWQALFPPGVPRTDNLDFGYLAKNYKIAGGNIRNILVSASYLAASDGGVMTMDHLLHGVRRELQKMGRLVGE